MGFEHINKEINEILEKSKKYMCLDDAKGLFYLTAAKKNLMCMEDDMPKEHISISKEKMSDCITRDTAFKWVSGMENSDGTKGEHWSLDMTNKLRIREGLTEIPEYEFYAVMNMLYSDYGEVADKYNLVGNLNFWLDMAKAWYYDEDAKSCKTSLYREYVTKK